MTRYGFSDPACLTEANRIARRGAAGYFMTMILCDFGRQAGLDLAGPEVFSMLFTYLFLSVFLLTSGRRRMLTVNHGPRSYAHIATISLLVAGFMLFIITMFTLVFTLGLVFGASTAP